MKPTMWFKHLMGNDDTVSVVGRWFWPEATKTEVNDGSGWRDAPVFLAMNDDPSWEQITETEADEWLAGQNPS